MKETLIAVAVAIVVALGVMWYVGSDTGSKASVKSVAAMLHTGPTKIATAIVKGTGNKFDLLLSQDGTKLIMQGKDEKSGTFTIHPNLKKNSIELIEYVPSDKTSPSEVSGQAAFNNKATENEFKALIFKDGVKLTLKDHVGNTGVFEIHPNPKTKTIVLDEG